METSVDLLTRYFSWFINSKNSQLQWLLCQKVILHVSSHVFLSYFSVSADMAKNSTRYNSSESSEAIQVGNGTSSVKYANLLPFRTYVQLYQKCLHNKLSLHSNPVLATSAVQKWISNILSKF